MTMGGGGGGSVKWGDKSCKNVRRNKKGETKIFFE